MLRPLEDVTIIEGGSATFQLELSQEGVTGEWARGGVRLQPGPKCHMHAGSRTHRLVLSGLGPADSGCVSFTVDSLRCAARLTVRGADSGPTDCPECDSTDPLTRVAPTDRACQSVTPLTLGPVWPQRLPGMSVTPLTHPIVQRDSIDLSVPANH